MTTMTQDRGPRSLPWRSPPWARPGSWPAPAQDVSTWRVTARSTVPRTRRTPRGWPSALGAVRLLGRGGAGFPVATKLAATPRGSRTHVLVNGSESEPASKKDRALMRLAPHLVLDGAIAVARALGTARVTVVVQDGGAHASLVAALRERPDAGVRPPGSPGTTASSAARCAR